MDIGIGVAMGTALRWLYDAIKEKLRLSDTAAAWGIMTISLGLATIWNVATGGFAGLTFDTTNPVQCLEAITAAWSTIYGTAAAWYPLTKERPSKK